MREQRWYARMFAVGAMALTLYAPPSAPPQPGTGPGGSHYPHAAVTRHGPYWANGHYRNANYEYVIYTPAKPAPEVATVVLFIHGWLAYRTTEYGRWIGHMVRKGYIVVWVQYDAGLRLPGTFAEHAMVAWMDALKRLDTDGWRFHVRPELDEWGQIKTAIVGHSAGGYLSAILAARAASGGNEIPRPYAIVAVEPGMQGLIPGADFAAIDPATKMVIVVGDEDNVVCKSTGVALWEGTSQIPDENRDFLLVQSDYWGTPEQVANHYFPNTSGYHDTAAVDARDFYVTYKLSVGALNCAFRGADCEYALGQGASEQVDMGKWSDGRAVRPMTWVEDPRGLETTCEDPPWSPSQRRK